MTLAQEEKNAWAFDTYRMILDLVKDHPEYHGFPLTFALKAGLITEPEFDILLQWVLRCQKKGYAI